jgi:putative membrane protein
MPADMTRKILVILTKLAINALALLVVDYLFDGIHLETTKTMIVAAVVLALVNSLLRPLVIILTLPINVLSLGLLTLVINALMLMLVAWLVPTFRVDGFWTAVFAAIVMSLVSFLLNWFLKPRRERGRVHVHVERHRW